MGMGDSSAYIEKYFFNNSKERQFTVLKYISKHHYIPICFIVITVLLNVVYFPFYLLKFKLNKYNIKDLTNPSKTICHMNYLIHACSLSNLFRLPYS